jgi:hypothetical protein
MAIWLVVLCFMFILNGRKRSKTTPNQPEIGNLPQIFAEWNVAIDSCGCGKRSFLACVPRRSLGTSGAVSIHNKQDTSPREVAKKPTGHFLRA